MDRFHICKFIPVYLTTLLDDVSYGVWIGLSDTSSEGHFMWADGSDVTYTNWAHLEPNGGLMVMLMMHNDNDFKKPKISKHLESCQQI